MPSTEKTRAKRKYQRIRGRIVTLHVSLDEELKTVLKTLAEKRGVSLSALVVDALDWAELKEAIKDVSPQS